MFVKGQWLVKFENTIYVGGFYFQGRRHSSK